MERKETKYIIVTGPESTGKSELVMRLSVDYDASFFPEYARDYISGLNRSYNYMDLDHIAKAQKAQISEAEKYDLVFFDTHLIITKIWFLWSFKEYPKWIDAEIEKTQSMKYLLCKPDIPWQEDKLRENGGENRIKLYNLYKKELESFKLDYSEVEGFGANRISCAKKSIDRYLFDQ